MSLKAAAQHIAAHGRNGDSTLVHMTHDEVRGLQELAKQHGTTLTINPQTGMPEAWSLSKLVKAAAPLAAGYFLGPAGYGLAAGEAGLAVGAGTALLTGSLEKGLMAGLGAYGGAGLSGAAEGAGAAELGKKSVEEGVKQNLTSEALQQKVTDDMAKTSGLDKILAGASSPGTMVDAAGGAGQMTKYGLAAAAPALMEQQGGAPSVPEAQGYIRPKYYDYRTQTFYDLPAVKAKDWGARSFDEYRNSLVAKPEYASGGLTEDGMAGGGPMMGTNSAFDFQQRSEPVVRMADGGLTADQAAAAQSWVAANPNATREDALSAAAAAGYTPEQANAAWSQFGPTAQTGISAAAPAASAPEYTSYSDEQYGNFFANNPNADIAAATKQFNADPNAVNQYISGLTSGYYDPTATQRGSGYLGQYQNLMKENMSPAEYAAAVQAQNPNWGKAGQYWTPTTVSHAYDVAEKILAFDPQTDKVTPSDKEWVAFMDSNKFSVDDISRATGLSTNEVQRRYDAAKEKPVVKPPLPTPGGVSTTGGGRTTDTYTGGVTTTPATYRPEGASNPYGNYINPGDLTINTDQSRTVTPNIPGRPYGGFTGMGQVRDAYTAGGGNLGQTLAPTRSYTNTGGSADAYKYLFGEGAWPSVTRATSPAKNTVGNTTSKYIWKDNMLVLNPDYVDPALAAAKTTTPVATTTVDSANGGLMAAYAHGGETHLGDYSDGGRLLRGPGDGVSDSIPATIGGKQPARLADGEFVVPARIVSELGNGSTEAGARKLYAMMDRVQKARGKTVGKGKVAKNTRADKYLPG